MEYICIILILFSTCLCMFSARWAVKYFGLSSFSQLIFHLKVPLSGSNTKVLYDWVKMCLIPSVILFLFIIISLYNIDSNNYVFFIFLSIIFLITYSLTMIGFPYYYMRQMQKTNLYEIKYINPREVDVCFKEKKNLILIYLESMENTYFSKENGGDFDIEVIPELLSIAKENINFSNSDKLGGAYQVISTGWTTAGLVGSSSGLPINMSFNAKKYKNAKSFINGAYSIGDVLKKEGYSQHFLCGSDASFGGRSYYYKKHGNFKIYDIYTARSNLDVSEDYHEFWGIEDAKLFKIAKKEITKLSQISKPFNYTMLTVDTHHPNGYICSECNMKFETNMENALACSSKQVGEFLEWIKKQPFYKKTVIVVLGDHLSMAAKFMDKTSPKYRRTTYNSFINAKILPSRQKNRNFCIFDYYPTILASMGATIEGDRLGFGTNLFSDKPTLIEEMGFDKFNKELAKRSKFYNRNIL